MAGYKISLKMPVIELSVTGEYSRFKKPTGLENLVLTAIGTPGLRSETWKKFFDRIAVPERMYPLFDEVIDQLYNNGMIDTNDFLHDERISNIEFTETGQNMFEQGRIKQEPKKFVKEMYYIPYAKAGDDQFLFSINTADDDGFDSARFENVTCNMNELHRFVSDNKKAIGADKGDEILSVKLDTEPVLSCVKKDISLQFDESSGNFYFESTMDSNFIKGHYDSKDLIGALDDIEGNPRNMVLTTVPKVPEEWGPVKYDLPAKFSLKGKFCAFNSELCSTIDATPLEGMTGAFADITSASIGREYVLIKKKASVFGLKGEVEIPVLVSHPLSSQQIVSLFDKVAETVQLLKFDQLMAFLEKTEVLNDPDYQLRIIRKHLDMKDDPTNSITKLSNAKGKWSKELPSVIEQHMYDSDRSLTTVVSMLEPSSVKIGGESLADKYRSGNPEKDLETADMIFRVSKSPGIVSMKLGVSNRIADIILNGEDGNYSSKELQAVCIASSCLKKLKGMFGVESPNKYDVSVFNDSETGGMIDTYSSLAKSMSVVKPLIRDSEGEKELNGYLDLFQNLTDIYSKDIPLENLSGYLFGIGIRRRIETALRDILKTNQMAAALLSEAHHKHIISDDELKELEKIREFGNECNHTKNVPPIDNKEKQRWIRLVKEIEKRIPQ